MGLRSYERSLSLAGHIVERSMNLLADRTAGQPGRIVAYNPLGWARDAVVLDPQDQQLFHVPDLPPFGYKVLDTAERMLAQPVEVIEDQAAIVLRRGELAVTIDRLRGVISQIVSAECPQGLLRADCPLADLLMNRAGVEERFEQVLVMIDSTGPQPIVLVERQGRDDACVTVRISLALACDAVDIGYQASNLPRPDGQMHASLRTTIGVNLPEMRLIHDHPYGLSEVRAEGSYPRKYPTGDWMTSPQVFEQVQRPFTALQLLDLTTESGGLLYLHDGGQAFLRTDNAVEQILTMYDPWDEDAFHTDLAAQVRIVPHGPIDNAQRWRLAQEFTRPVLVAQSNKQSGDLPARFGPIWSDAPGVALSAWFRETSEAGRGLETYAGSEIDHPTILRLVELNGDPTTVSIRIAGSVGAAFCTNLMGEIIAPLGVITAEAPMSGPLLWSTLSIDLQPYQIATLYLDLELARKVARDLDSYRSVWATVHRIAE